MENQSLTSEEFLALIYRLPVLNESTFSNLRKQTQTQPELLKEIFSSFFEDVNEMIAGLKTAAEQKDYQNYTSTLHTLKGLAGTIGASRLHEVTNLLYSKARNNDFSDAANGVPLLHQCIIELKDELEGKI